MTGMEFGIWSGVTGVLMILSTLFGMRIEVRGVSGIVADVKSAIAKIEQEIQDLKDKAHGTPQPVA